MTENGTYITAQGLEKIKAELEELTGHGRERISLRLRSAVEQGDLSENADYLSAKEDQAFLEGRILELEQILKNVIIIDNLEQDNDVISVGNTVTIQEDGFPEETYFVVGPKETDPQNGRISHLSPIGKAIIGKRSGDEVSVETPDGELKFKILKVT